MAEQNKPFVVTDRRKFSLDGTLRPDADREPQSGDSENEASAESAAQPSAPASPPPELPAHDAQPEPLAASNPGSEPDDAAAEGDQDVAPPPTQEDIDAASMAYQQTSERLDTAVRAANPGMERPPTMSFEAIVQSIFMTTLLQLGATAPEGQQPRIDLMGARQSIDMLGILAEKTRGNLNDKESQLLESALFELRMGFLEVTQALARSAGARGPAGPGGPGAPGGGIPGRPSIVR